MTYTAAVVSPPCSSMLVPRRPVRRHDPCDSRMDARESLAFFLSLSLSSLLDGCINRAEYPAIEWLILKSRCITHRRHRTPFSRNRSRSEVMYFESSVRSQLYLSLSVSLPFCPPPRSDTCDEREVRRCVSEEVQGLRSRGQCTGCLLSDTIITRLRRSCL